MVCAVIPMLRSCLAESGVGRMHACDIDSRSRRSSVTAVLFNVHKMEASAVHSVAGLCSPAERHPCHGLGTCDHRARTSHGDEGGPMG